MTQPEIIISTDAVEPCLRNDFWREVTFPVFDTTPVDGTTSTPLCGAIHSRPVGGLLIGTVSFNAQRYRRDRRVIAQGGLDHYMIQMLTAGTMRGTFGRRSVTAEPGDICIMDFTRTFESRVDTGARMTMAVPRKDLENALGRRDLHGAVLKAGAPMTQLLIDFLQGLIAVSARLSASEAFAAQGAMVSLLAAGLAGQDITGHAAPSALNEVLRERVIEFIDANLTRPELGPELLMRRFRISRAHLYRAFTEDGGVGTLIRNKRLDAAYLALTHHRGRERSITEIATECGFSSSARFLRAFRSHFGFTPSDAKREGVMPAVAPGDGSHLLQRHFANYHSAPATGSRAQD
ncbi:helix-turn-helix domain-containing protein [Burkholderia sp. Ac-20353]|uniref:AraC-like ligand-binding domain-containing protein n=1 Tax=Burkholderia sp. Ac-20353 TaxID=2703894 RepID=UPI00197BA617|nr:helix-turn-helix domain-containing protein [Burkholderia sp. Ac-20353]